MALLTIKRKLELERTYVLAPERYDPRRESLRSGPIVKRAVPLGNIVKCVRQTISPTAKMDRELVVIDTSDVREGIIVGRKCPTRLGNVGSAKKLFQHNDVLISRLRPYLRQVAFVDTEFAAGSVDVVLACSTEFFVLRSLNEESIAFLVPYLLSTPV